MARPLRIEFPGALRHVIVRGNERKAVFRDDADRVKYLASLSNYREKFGFRLLAYCLMDNHVHLAIETADTPLSALARLILPSCKTDPDQPRRFRSLRLRAHRLAARPVAGSTARLVPRSLSLPQSGDGVSPENMAFLSPLCGSWRRSGEFGLCGVRLE